MKAVSFSKQSMAVSLVGAAMALSSAGVYAADIDTVKVTYDKDVAARTNMGERDMSQSTLGVSRDADVLTRTNLPKPEGTLGPVGISRDSEYMSRTNMGGIAKKTEPAPQTAATQH